MKNFNIFSAFLCLLFAFVLAVLGFFAPPQGEISDSVLWLTAQCLLFAASALGVNVVIEQKVKSLSNNKKDAT